VLHHAARIGQSHRKTRCRAGWPTDKKECRRSARAHRPSRDPSGRVLIINKLRSTMIFWSSLEAALAGVEDSAALPTNLATIAPMSCFKDSRAVRSQPLGSPELAMDWNLKSML